MTGEKVLLYQLKGTETGKKLQPVLLRMGIRIRAVEPEEYDIPVGMLAGVKDMEVIPEKEGVDDPAVSVDISSPMMIMCGLTGSRVDELLRQMRRAGVPLIDLKAMLTPTNLNWNSRQLYEELEKEHEAMQAYRKG